MVRYCLRRIELLQRNGVIPYVVFDGCYLPMKAGTEEKRASDRRRARKEGNKRLAKGDGAGAHSFFTKAVEVTPAMAREFIVELEARGISFVVAPYEADAQLAWLCQNQVVDFVISEDSDCVPFGCSRMFFKMGHDGEGHELRRRNLGANEEISLLNWTDDMILTLCISEYK